MSYRNCNLGVLALAGALGLGLAACSDGRGHKLDDGGNNTGGDGSNNNTGGDAGPGGNCAVGADLVYVVDEHNALFSFTPNTLAFTELGPLNCPAAGGATPFSMGVDRNAVAWILYSDGSLFKVPTSDVSNCTATTFAMDQSGFQLFGMGFASDSSGGTTDTLYIAGGPNTGGNQLASSTMLGTLSFPGLTVSQSGTVNGQPELTGTGTGDLWGFFPNKNGSSIEKLDKTSGTASTTYSIATNHGTPAAWAFAFWGGDLWAFLQTSNDASTQVYQVDGSTGALKANTAAPNRIIVGAGVSTCAPTQIQ
jgi:hypothetical protein